jgi:hypothetical protein
VGNGHISPDWVRLAWEALFLGGYHAIAFLLSLSNHAFGMLGRSKFNEMGNE